MNSAAPLKTETELRRHTLRRFYSSRGLQMEFGHCFYLWHFASQPSPIIKYRVPTKLSVATLFVANRNAEFGSTTGDRERIVSTHSSSCVLLTRSPEGSLGGLPAPPKAPSVQGGPTEGTFGMGKYLSGPKGPFGKGAQPPVALETEDGVHALFVRRALHEVAKKTLVATREQEDGVVAFFTRSPRRHWQEHEKQKMASTLFVRRTPVIASRCIFFFFP